MAKGKDKIKNERGAGRKRKLTPLEESVCYKNYIAGVPPAEIAYKNEISPATLQRIIKRYRDMDK